MNRITECDPDVLAIQRAQALADVLKRTHHGIRSKIVGSSMGGVLHHGATIHIQPEVGGKFILGQVVACLQGKRLVAHRVVYCGEGRLNGYLITRGDARVLCDAPIEHTAILGVVDAHIANGILHILTPENHRLSHENTPWDWRCFSAVLILRFTIGFMHINVKLAKFWVLILHKCICRISRIYKKLRLLTMGFLRVDK